MKYRIKFYSAICPVKVVVIKYHFGITRVYFNHAQSCILLEFKTPFWRKKFIWRICLNSLKQKREVYKPEDQNRIGFFSFPIQWFSPILSVNVHCLSQADNSWPTCHSQNQKPHLPWAPFKSSQMTPPPWHLNSRWVFITFFSTTEGKSTSLDVPQV